MSRVAFKRTFSLGDFAVPPTRCSPHRIAFLDSPNGTGDAAEQARKHKRPFLGLSSAWDASSKLPGLGTFSADQKEADMFDPSSPFSFTPSDTSGLGLAMAPISALTPISPLPSATNSNAPSAASSDSEEVKVSAQNADEDATTSSSPSPARKNGKRSRLDMSFVRSLQKKYVAFKQQQQLKKRHLMPSTSTASSGGSAQDRDSDVESLTQGVKRGLSSLQISSPVRGPMEVQQENAPVTRNGNVPLEQQEKPFKVPRKADTLMVSSKPSNTTAATSSSSSEPYSATDGKKNYNHLVLDGGKVDLETLVPKKKKISRADVLDLLEEALWIQESFLKEQFATDMADALQDQHDTFCNYNRDSHHRDTERNEASYLS